MSVLDPFSCSAHSGVQEGWVRCQPFQCQKSSNSARKLNLGAFSHCRDARRTGRSLVVRAQTSVARAPVSRQIRPGDDFQRHVYWTSERIQITATVEKLKKGFNVFISIPPHNQIGQDLTLQWGMFRTSAEKWFNPEEVVVSEPTSGNGRGHHARLTKTRSGDWEAKFSVPAKLAPVYLAFQLHTTQQSSKRELLPATGSSHFAVPLGLGQCSPLLLGASMGPPSADGKSTTVNFVVNSRNATTMSLCVARRQQDGRCGGYLEIALDPDVNRRGDAWNVSLDGLKDLKSLCYGWRADADISWDMGNRFHPGQVMLDPYAQTATKVYLPDGVNVPPPSKGLPSSDPRSNPPAYLGCLSALLTDFNWHGILRPETPLERTVVLELDIPRFSRGKEVSAQNQGKFLGVLDRVQELKKAGITAVMVTPVTLSGEGLGPFSRAPFSFFAPHPELATGEDPEAPSLEMKTLIRELHAEGIEVYLQVAYSLTGEGWDESASAVSLRGLDAAVYYRAKGVLNCGHANVRSLILASLKHWLREYQVDGFCFLHAETLALDRDGTVLDSPPLAEDIAHDAHLQTAKLIAWSADDTLLPRKGQRGFPHWAIWQERNKRFTYHFSQFFKDHRPADIASSIATRICGSADMFGPDTSSGFPGTLATGRRPAFGFNAPSFLDSSPLNETAAGILSPMAPPEHHAVLKRSLLLATMISGGTPLLGADILDDPSLTDFVGRLAVMRRELSKSLFPVTFEGTWSINWLGAYPGTQPDWDGELARTGVPAAAYLAYTVFPPEGSGVYVAYNPYEGPVPATLSGTPEGMCWWRAVDTGDEARPALPRREWIPLTSSEYTVTAKGAILLVAAPVPKASLQRTSQPGAGPNSPSDAGPKGPFLSRLQSSTY